MTLAMTTVADARKLISLDDLLQKAGMSPDDLQKMLGGSRARYDAFTTHQGDPIYFKAVSVDTSANAIRTGTYNDPQHAPNMYKFGRDLSTEMDRISPDRPVVLAMPFSEYVKGLIRADDDPNKTLDERGRETLSTAPLAVELDPTLPIEFNKAFTYVFSLTLDTYNALGRAIAVNPDAKPFRNEVTQIHRLDPHYLAQFDHATQRIEAQHGANEAGHFIAGYFTSRHGPGAK